jgi:hypothetical protein
MDALFDGVSVTVKRGIGGNVLYSGTLRGAGTGMYSAAGVGLGTLPSGAYGTLDIELSVDGNLGNDYQNGLCAVNWTFSATQYEPEDEDEDGATTSTTTTEPSETATSDPTETTTTEPEGSTAEPVTEPSPSASEPTTAPTGPAEPTAGPTDPDATDPTGSQPAEPTTAPTNPAGGGGDMSDDPPAAPPTSSVDVTVPSETVPLGSIGDGLIESLPDEEMPFGALTDQPDGPDMVVVVDPAIPLGVGLPQTGGLLTYASAAGIALIGLLVLYAATFIKKRRDEEA